MMGFAINWLAIVEILVALILLAQGIVVLIQNPRSPLNISFFFFQLAVFVWMAGMSVVYFFPGIDGEIAALFFARLGFVGVTFIPVSTYAFSVFFSGQKNQLPIIRIGLVITIVTSVFLYFPFFVSGLRHLPWGPYIKLGPGGLVILLFFAVFMALFTWNLYLRYREAHVGKRWYVFALLAGALSYLGIIDFLPAYGFVLPVPPLGFIFVGILSTLMGYFMLRYSLMDIRLLFGRTFGYLFLSAAFIAIYLMLFLGLAPFSREGNILVGALFFLIAVYTFGYAERFSQRIIDELFFREQRNFKDVVSRFHEKIHILQSPEKLLERLFECLTGALRIRSAHVLILMPKERQWFIYGSSRSSLSPERVSADSYQFDSQLFKPHSVFDVSHFSFSEENSDFMNGIVKTVLSRGGKLIMPLRGKVFSLGFLVVGVKQSEESFSYREKEALGYLAESFSVAWENAKLYEDIERENKLKLNFISVISHQLRTPLTRIKWGLETLSHSAHEKLTPKELADFNGLSSGADAAIVIVNQLLEVAETEKETADISSGSVSLFEIINSVVLIKKRDYAAEKLAVEVSGQETEVFVEIEKKHLAVILDILLDNAFQYNHLGGAISIRIADDSSDMVRCEISDTGIGIEEGERGRVFEKFFRGQRVFKLRPNGTGLGLYYARLLIERYGGKLWFSSHDGGGSTFFFTLPRGKSNVAKL